MIADAFFNAGILQEAWPILARGLLTTVLLSVVVVPLGFAGGLGLALLSTVRHRGVRAALVAWVDLFRAFPPLVLLIFLYAGLPFAGLRLGAFACVAVGFFLNTGAYYAEVLRHVVLPPAMRNVLPDLLSNTLEVVKLTSLASVVALPELLFQARQAQSVTFNATPVVAAAALYFLLLWPLVRLLSRLENRAIAARRA